MTNTDLLTLIFVAIISAGLAGLIAYDIARNHYIKKLAKQIVAKTAHKGDTAKWLAEITTARSNLKEIRDILAEYESPSDTRHGCPSHCLSLSTCNKQCSERQAPA